MDDEFNILREKYPRLVSARTYFEHGPGWLSVLDRYFAEVDAALPADVEWHISQIKEKFGTLRLYCSPTSIVDKDVDLKLNMASCLAEARSSVTCEQCGKPGRLVDRKGYMSTACEEHAEGGENVDLDDSYWVVDHRKFRYDPDKDVLVEAPKPEA